LEFRVECRERKTARVSSEKKGGGDGGGCNLIFLIVF
jgi:hypothetical protein